MSIAQTDSLEQLQERVKRLIGLYEEQKEELERYRSRNKDLEEEVRQGLERLEEVEQNFNKLKISKALIASSEDVHDAKLKLNRMVREIDKCIALLNR
jgi:archaellum component FlaC